VWVEQLSLSLGDEEINKTVLNMTPWKAPGPDGYPAGVYQKSWHVVGKSI
jgi:hypothetical protein